jgi:hypothetical protein
MRDAFTRCEDEYLRVHDENAAWTAHYNSMQGVKIALIESLSASTDVRATVPGLALESEDAAQYTVVVHRAEGADIGWMCHPSRLFESG